MNPNSDTFPLFDMPFVTCRRAEHTGKILKSNNLMNPNSDIYPLFDMPFVTCRRAGIVNKNQYLIS
jgi:hypothetical protein